MGTALYFENPIEEILFHDTVNPALLKRLAGKKAAGSDIFNSSGANLNINAPAVTEWRFEQNEFQVAFIELQGRGKERWRTSACTSASDRALSRDTNRLRS